MTAILFEIAYKHMEKYKHESVFNGNQNNLAITFDISNSMSNLNSIERIK